MEAKDHFNFLTDCLCLDQQRYLCRVVTIDIIAGIFLVTRLVAEMDFLLNRCFVSVVG